jgi:hypothetical protein
MPRSDFLAGNTNSAISMGRLSRWIDTCNENHRICLPEANTLLPKRVIDVTEVWEDGIPGVKLVQPTTDQFGNYICLSHCWGREPIKCRTTKDTLTRSMHFMKFEEFPKSFRDAISITRALAIQYLWIDSVSIIQDDQHD